MNQLLAAAPTTATFLTFAGPSLLLLWTHGGSVRYTLRELAAACTVVVGATLALTAIGWHVEPDYAGSPRAALAFAAVLQVPALLTMAVLLRALRDFRPWARLATSLTISYVIVGACVVPGLLIFVQLGGDTL